MTEEDKIRLQELADRSLTEGKSIHEMLLDDAVKQILEATMADLKSTFGLDELVGLAVELGSHVHQEIHRGGVIRRQETFVEMDISERPDMTGVQIVTVRGLSPRFSVSDDMKIRTIRVEGTRDE